MLRKQAACLPGARGGLKVCAGDRGRPSPSVRRRLACRPETQDLHDPQETQEMNAGAGRLDKVTASANAPESDSRACDPLI